MAFDVQTFLGLKVIDFSSSVGWNDSGSTLTIKMAPEDGEVIEPYKIGEIKDFSFGGKFTFVGFLDRVIERHSSGGITYEATLSDGKEILRNVQCVVGNLYGTTAVEEDCLVDNYFNIFRHYEKNGYGQANSNSSGMDAKKFVSGVAEMSAKCFVKNGSEKYSVDISAVLKGLPDYYRIPGPKVGLLDVVSQICEVTGHLWRLVLEGSTFRIKLQSLAQDAANQKVGDTIKTMAKNKKCISWDAGDEASNGVTSNFVVWGGAKENTIIFDRGNDSYVNPNSVVKYYWGVDINGTPQTSVNYEILTRYNLLGNPYTLEVMENILIPTIGIEDIEGENYYLTNSVELQCVMGCQESWEFYLELYQPGRYQKIFLRAARDWNPDRFYWTAYGGAGSTPLRRYFSEKENDVGVRRAARLYSYLKSYCETFWGKQFLIQVNGGNEKNLRGVSNNIGNDGATSKTGGLTVRNKLEKKSPQDPLTDEQKGTYNILPTQSGWYDKNLVSSGPFSGIPKEIFEGQFKDPKGKMQNWVMIKALPGTYQIDDTSSDCYVLGNYIYLKLTVSDKYVLVNGVEHVHVSLPQSVVFIKQESERSELGDDILSKWLFGIFGPVLIGSSELFKVGFLPITPQLMAINFSATTNDAYGPWYINSGKGGLTKIEHDSSLTPWEFGSSANLAEVFADKLKDIKPIDKFETGSLTMVSAPEHQIGDELVKNGAIVTSINVSYGPNGVTTQYSFRTFTPRFGITSEIVINRLKQQVTKQNEDRRNILKAYMDTIARQQSANRSEMGGKIRSFFLDFLGRRHDRMSPHPLMVMGIGIANAGAGASKGSGMYSRSKTLGASYKQNESMKDLGKKLYDFIEKNSKSAISIDTLYVPFRNNFSNNFSSFFLTSGYLPHCWPVTPDVLVSQKFTNYRDPQYERGDKLVDVRQGKVPTSITYNPFKRFSHFDTLMDHYQNYWDNHNEPMNYAGTEGAQGGGSQTIDVNAIALRGPLMVSGWGVDLWTGEVVPPNDYGLTNRFTPDPVLANAPWEAAENKMTGPVDLIWDSARGMWTSHDVVRVVSGQIIPASNFTCNASGRLSYGYMRMYANDLESNQYVQVYNLSSKPQIDGVQTLAHYSVYDNRWYIKGEGSIPRYNDLKVQQSIYNRICVNGCDYNITPGSPAKSALPFYADFEITENSADPYEIPKVDDNGNLIYCKEHGSVDIIRTYGMNTGVAYHSGNEITCPDGTVVPIINTLWFWHGLAKEIIYPEMEDICDGHEGNTDCYLIKTAPDGTYPCYECRSNPIPYLPVETFSNCQDCSGVLDNYNDSCTTTTTTTTTTTAAPLYCIVETGSKTGCFNCTQFCDSIYYLQGPYPLQECNSYLPALNVGCGVNLEFDDPCWSCHYSPTGSYTGPTRMEDCQADANSNNEELGYPCVTTTTTTTASPCQTYYLRLNPDTNCYICSLESNEPYDESYPGYIDIDGNCTSDCQVAADNANEASGSICTTTTTTTTTVTSTTSTTTTTTLAPDCILVVEDVVCRPESPGEGYISGGGDIWTKKTFVTPCEPVTRVVQSSFPNLEVKLLRAELKALTKKFVEIVDVLEKHNIKVF